MIEEDRPKKINKNQNIINFTLAVVAGQVGCLTLVIILIATAAGLWLDNQYQTKPAFTIGLLVCSVPISLALMFVVVRMTIKRIKENANENQSKEEESGLGNQS